jgi:putative molybdopterin biosynthesis protein
LERGAPQPSLPNPVPGEDLRFVGSHDPLVGLLARFLKEFDPSFDLSITYAGSLGGLFALARGEADLCGIHLWDSHTDSYNVPFVVRVLPGRRVLLLTLAHRHLGLILPPGNPAGIGGLSDLARPDVRFVNRQPGSGTRVWLDDQLRASGIPREMITGYERAEITHVAVADAVARGEASAGLGIYAAASSFGLDFLPLTLERYELAIPEELTGEAPMQGLQEIIRSPRMKEAIQLVGGYDASETGSVRWTA